MSDNIDPLMNKNGDAGQEVLVSTYGVSSSGSNAFPWVESAVLARTSILLSPESITPFMNIVRRRFPEVSKFLILEPPLANEYICSGPSTPTSPAFTFIYETFLTKLKVPLPFTYFECQVLNLLNVAPTQLHPNSWGFVRAFEILCQYHNIAPSIRVFSYYFQAKLGNRPVGWTSLNGFSGRPLLNVIHSSYKDFKPHYFRLRGTEANSELLFNSLGEPKFPLYWTKNPSRLRALKESNLTESELIDVKLLSSFIAVDCNVLIEKEGDAGALQPYIVEMSGNQEGFIPTMDAKAMRAFSKNNKRKQGSQASGPVVVTDHEVSSSTVSDKLVSKKSCTEKEPISTSVPLSPNQEVVQIGTSSQPLLVTSGIPKWWHWFQGFEGQPGTEVVSVFDRRLPTEQLIRSHFLKTDDFVRVKKVGMVNTAKMVQVFAAQTAVLGQALEVGVGLLEKELKEKTKKLKDGQTEVAKAKEAVFELARLQEEFKALSLEKEKAVADLAVLKKEKEDSDTLLTEKTKLLEKAEEKLVAEQKGRKEESDHLKAEITFQYEQGFEKAIDQVKFLHPEINVDEAGPFKEVRDGRLVDIPDDE
ncbi:hypothetical protein SESBI_18428 [Sesbania bispinosa]|nr:hypothetical protein SESBI_18428 [Sesbania bispinosa]